MKTLIIDSSHIFYQNIWTMPDLGYDEKKTHIIFGFLSKIISLSKKFQTNKFIFCFDSKYSERKKIYPPYKEKRKKEKTEEEIEMFKFGFQQLHELEDSVLTKLGFKNIFKQEGYESDDIIAQLAKKYGKKFEFTVVSSDEDLYQLLDDCSIYNSKSGKVYTAENFREEYDIEPTQWASVKAIAGCKSDCVEGVKGVGEKFAIKYLKGELNKGKKLESIVSQNGKEIAKRNMPLVELPYEGTNNFKLSINERFNLEDFISICELYDFRSFLTGDGIEKWKEIFCGGLSKT